VFFGALFLFCFAGVFVLLFYEVSICVVASSFSLLVVFCMFILGCCVLCFVFVMRLFCFVLVLCVVCVLLFYEVSLYVCMCLSMLV